MTWVDAYASDVGAQSIVGRQRTFCRIQITQTYNFRQSSATSFVYIFKSKFVKWTRFSPVFERPLFCPVEKFFLNAVTADVTSISDRYKCEFWHGFEVNVSTRSFNFIDTAPEGWFHPPQHIITDELWAFTANWIGTTLPRVQIKFQQYTDDPHWSGAEQWPQLCSHIAHAQIQSSCSLNAKLPPPSKIHLEIITYRCSACLPLILWAFETRIIQSKNRKTT